MSTNTMPVSLLAHLPHVVIFAIVGVVSLLYLGYQWALPKPLPNIPYNKGALRSILGDAPEVAKLVKDGGRPRVWLSQQPAKHNSPLVQVFLAPLSKPMLILADWRESQDILLRRGKEFDRGSRNNDALRGVIAHHHIGMQTSSARFKANRELVKDLMTPHFLNTVSAPEIYSNTLKFVGLWKLKSQKANGRPFRADLDIDVMAFDIIKIVAFGDDQAQSMTEVYQSIVSNTNFDTQHPDSKDTIFTFPDHLLNEDLEANKLQQIAVGESVTSPSPALFHMLNNRKPSMRGAYAIKNRMLDKQVTLAIKRAEAGEEVKSALDYMIKREYNSAKKADRKPVYDSPYMKDELYGYIGAGHETTATSVQWGLKHLSIHIDIQKKIRSALRATYAEATAERRQPTVLEITKLQVPYLEAVMEEILRLTGPVLGVMRQAMIDTTVLGHAVAKGTEVYMPTMGASIAEQSYNIDESLRSQSSQAHKYARSSWDDYDPEKFVPERWLKNDNGVESFDSQAGPFLSFSNGVRGCFGRRLAYLEFRILMALLIWNLELGTLPEEFNTFDAIDTLTTRPAKCFVRISEAKL